MLEAPILDNTERLLAESPYLGLPSWEWMHMEQLVAGTTKFNHVYNNGGGIYDNVLDFWLIRGTETATALYRFRPDQQRLGNTLGWVQDSTLQLHQFVVESSSGRVWAVVNNSSGVDGLYRRDASITSPNWTRVVGATNGATLKMYRHPDGSIYYRDETAGNYYKLENGAAGSASTSAPAGLNIAWATASVDYRWNVDRFQAYSGDGFWSVAQTNWLNTTGRPSIETNPHQSWFFLYENSVANPAAGTHKCIVPAEWAYNARWPNQLNNNNNSFMHPRTYRLDDTYSLLLINSVFVDETGGSTATRFITGGMHDFGKQKVSVAILNKVTWQVKYLGVFFVPSVRINYTSAVAEQTVNQVPVGARMKDGAIHVIFSGEFARDYNGGAAVTYCGLNMATVPFVKPLDI